MPVQSKFERKGFCAEPDYRSGPERDRDRILFSSALHRLAGISQIVNSIDLSGFHNRYQHTIKVAQVGRRLAESLIQKNKDQALLLGLNDDVVDIVEAACLAHDLGHPPFGHVGEETLNSLAERTAYDTDGRLSVNPQRATVPTYHSENCFEGNAQTFRILTKLAVRFPERGMNLMRATLSACLKYPWLRDGSDPKKRKKWGAYSSEFDDFLFAREHCPGEQQTVEAHIMDWADDIAYSVHDLEEFHRCNFFDWPLILAQSNAERIVEGAQARWFGCPDDAEDRLYRALNRIRSLAKLYPRVFEERYVGSRWQRYELRNLNSLLVSRYIGCVDLEERSELKTGLYVPDNYYDEVLILKEFTKQFVLTDPSLLAQQMGHRKIVTDLYKALIEDINNCWSTLDDANPVERTAVYSIVPERLRYLWEFRDENPIRFALDCIASLTEQEALEWHGRLSGTSSKSVLDPIVQ